MSEKTYTTTGVWEQGLVAFPYAEARLQEAVGLGAADFRLARKGLVRGLDWEVGSKRTVLSERGFYGLLEGLGLAYKKPDGSFGALAHFDLEDLKKRAAVSGAGHHGSTESRPTVKGVIERFPINRFLVQVRLEDGRRVFVFIPRDRALLKRGMEMPCRAQKEGLPWMMARAMPRRKGRW